MTRDEAVAIALTWKSTPYVLGGRVKGAGVDCASYIAEYLLECGFATKVELGHYGHDWFKNYSEERYMFGLIRYARKTLETICRGTIDAKPGSIVLFKSARSKLYNHGGIITKWPFMLHAISDGVKESNVTTHYLTAHCQMAVFDPWSNEC